MVTVALYMATVGKSESSNFQWAEVVGEATRRSMKAVEKKVRAERSEASAGELKREEIRMAKAKSESP
jgi:hypothetical protein